MHGNRKSQSTSMDLKGLGLQDYLEILWRRKWWLILPFIVGTGIAAVYSYSLPPMYRSSTLILVESQKIPTSYVSSTITFSMQERLNTLRQQITSRTKLEGIIKKFGLYKKELEAAVVGEQDPVDRLKATAKKVLATFGLHKQPASVALNPQVLPEEFVDRMRGNIEIRVEGSGNSAFTVAYQGRDPSTVMQVTNTLAALFIEENLKVRERLAEEASAFLERQLREAAQTLEEQESALKEFRKKHMGALPGQMDANLRTLDRLQLELQAIGDALRNAADRKMFYERRRTESPTETAPELDVTLPAVPAQTGPDPLEVDLRELKKELARLQTQFKDTYPDIIALKKRLGDTEAQLAAKSPVSVSEPARQIQSIRPQKTPVQQVQTRPQTQLETVDAEIKSLQERRERVTNLIKEYQERVENTFANEQNVLSLTRDYQMSQQNYQSLLQKKLAAKLSEDLEKRQQGEQFRILDPANLPTQPYKPDRSKIILLGSVLSGGVGAGIALLLEYFQAVFRKPEDFQGLVEVPILVTIPRYETPLQHQEYHLATMEEIDSMVTEQYRILYTKISNLIEKKTRKVFAISSAMPGDGKTVTALNLAVVIARDFGKKTLLLEGDFRRPSMSPYLKVELEDGLVDLLLRETDMHSPLIPFADVLIPFADDNLSVLPAVKSVPNSMGLLSSRRMRELLETVKEEYDVILIDAPPVLPLADMGLFEKVVDGIILIVRAERTPRSTLLKAIDALSTDKLVGIVLNGMPKSSSYYPYVYKKT